MKKISFLLAVLLLTITAIAQELSVNTSKSEIKWTGKKVTGEHWGYIAIKNGTLKVDGDKIASGKFSIDMSSINCKDLEDAEWNGKLVGHLKSDDFFGVEKHPESVLKITKSTAFKNGEADVTGELTIKGISQPISFKAKKSDNGYDATISIDRTKYNVKYGSGKFFDDLGDKMIYDEFVLDIKLVTE